MYSVQPKIDTGKAKIIDIPAEDASNDTEGFLTPGKRSTPSESDEDHTSFDGTQKSSSKYSVKSIKIEKMK